MSTGSDPGKRRPVGPATWPTPSSPNTCRVCRVRRTRRYAASWTGRAADQDTRRGGSGRPCSAPVKTGRRQVTLADDGSDKAVCTPEPHRRTSVVTPTDTIAPQKAKQIHATALGAPRIGPNRELKKAVEAYWAGNLDADGLAAVAAGLRRDTRAGMMRAGFDSVPTNTFSYYDQMLDTAVLLGALPPRVLEIEDPLDRYFAAARGAEGIRPLEMTKWFDTNYHYLVPEISDDMDFDLHPEHVLADL